MEFEIKKRLLRPELIGLAMIFPALSPKISFVVFASQRRSNLGTHFFIFGNITPPNWDSFCRSILVSFLLILPLFVFPL